jgi:hypothetical protein
MMREVYDISKEPSAESYREVIMSAAEYCAAFTLVVRSSVGVDESATNLLSRLGTFLISESEESKWPGTHLLEGNAMVYKFVVCQEALDLLISASGNLFGWLQPSLPEDLCFLRPDESPWLVTIAHEKDGYFLLAEDEVEKLRKTVPDLRLRPHSKD